MRDLNSRKEFSERRKWHAHWIHNNIAGSGPWYCFFRKEFEITKETLKAVMDISADRQYKLFIDGEFIGEGPLRSSGQIWSYDTYDVSGLLKKGKHAIGVIVSQWNPSGPGQAGDPSFGGGSSPLAMLCEIKVTCCDGGVVLISSDQTWKAHTARGWRSDAPAAIWAGPLQVGYIEVRDLGADDSGWNMKGFNDSGWNNAGLFAKMLSNQPVKAYGAKWKFLVPRDMPRFRNEIIKPARVCACGEVKGVDIYFAKQLLWEHQWIHIEDIRPARTAQVNNIEEFIAGEKPIEMTMVYDGEPYGRILWQPAVVLDMGTLENAYIQLDIEGAAGTIIDITYAQTLQEGKVIHYGGGIYRVARFILKEGRQEIETFEYVNARYLQITVVEADRPVRLHAVRFRVTSYPIDETAEFSCSDELLTRVWNATEKTTRLCMLDLFMDNTWREKRIWGGDVSMILLSALTCYGKLDLYKRYLRMFIYTQMSNGHLADYLPDGRGEFFDHSMAIPMRVQEYYDYTGDIELLRELYPGLRRYMEFLERYEEEDGTIGEIGWGIWFDWTVLDRRTPSAILNGYYYLVICSMEKIASVLGLKDDAEIYESKRENLIKSIDKFWDENRGVFPDCKVGGEFSDIIGEDANGIMLCTGAVSKDKTDKIIKNIFSHGFELHKQCAVQRSGPPFSLHVLRGLCRSGYIDIALDYIRQRHGSAFEQGLDTMPESWLFSDRGETSAAQGTLAAAYILTSEILGIKPAEPGFKKVLIAPKPCSLSWAKGTAITPYGIVKSRWSKSNDSFVFHVEIPEGASGIVEMPYEGGGIVVESTPASKNYECRLCDETNRYLVSLEDGKYTITLHDVRY